MISPSSPFVRTGLSEGYSIFVATVVTNVWYCFTKSVSIMAVLISLIFAIVNFFSIFNNADKWYFSVPMILCSSLYTLVLNYESMVLNNALEYPTMFADWSTKLWFSKRRLS